MLKRYRIRTRDKKKWVGKSPTGYMLTPYYEQSKEFDLSTATLLMDRLEDQLNIKLELRAPDQSRKKE